MGLAFLPHYAFEAAHAIVQTLVRVAVTRSAPPRVGDRRDRRRSRGRPPVGRTPFLYLEMAASPLAALLTAILVAAARPSALLLAAPVVALWAASPLLAWWLSRAVTPATRSSRTRPRVLPADRAGDLALLRGDGDGRLDGLAPDNAALRDESGVAVVAPRTSPTNVGLGLLADLAAHDLGWLDAEALLTRIERTLGTVEGSSAGAGTF